MLYIVNDTRIKIFEESQPDSQGGSAAYCAGLINHLLHSHIDFGLIGNFNIPDNRPNAHISHPSTNRSFLAFLFRLFLVNKFRQNDIFYFQRPDHLACAVFTKAVKVLHLHGQQRTNIIRSRNVITKFTYLFLERIAMHQASLILATDKTTASVYTTAYPFIAQKIKIVPTGIDRAFFSDQTSPALPPPP